jgi:hypothetical protein
MRSAGICQVAFGQLISERRMSRISTGLVMVSAMSCRAARTVGQPSYSSIDTIRAPSWRSSVIAGRC